MFLIIDLVRAQCLEILRVLARALLGATPDMVPPDTVDDVRQALLGQTEALVTNFVLNIKQSIDVRHPIESSDGQIFSCILVPCACPPLWDQLFTIVGEAVMITRAVGK